MKHEEGDNDARFLAGTSDTAADGDDCSSEISAADTDLLCAAVCSDAPDSLDWGGCGAWPYQTEKGFSVGKENKSLCHCGLCKK